MVEVTYKRNDPELVSRVAKAIDEIEPDIRNELGAKGELRANIIKYANPEKSAALVQFIFPEYDEYQYRTFYPVLTIVF